MAITTRLVFAGARAEAQVEPLPAPEPPLVETPFGSQYLIEGVEVQGNKKTRVSVITSALDLRKGDVVAPDDPRVEASRFSVLALGLFEDVHLSIRRGTERGRVVLVVEVVERGTIVLNELFLGNSNATTLWGGLDVSENNFLGHGISLSGGFVAGSQANVPGSRFQQAYRLRLWDPDLRGSGIGVGGELLYNRGSEFFRAQGPDESSAPGDFAALNYTRTGGALGSSFELGRVARIRLSYRLESLDAALPMTRSRTLANGALVPIEFQIRPGRSLLTVLGVSAEFDTRSDPILPERGYLFVAEGQLSTRAFGSDYDYGKLTLSYDHYGKLPWKHVIAARLYGGGVVGRGAPFFEKFFIGDINRLLPPRALGLNFSTLPSRALLGMDGIALKRYEEVAARFAVEYAIPLWRGGRFLYGGNLFAQAGVFTLTSHDALSSGDRALGGALPFDLTLDLGLRVDTYIGVFTLSIGNALGRIEF